MLGPLLSRRGSQKYLPNYHCIDHARFLKIVFNVGLPNSIAYSFGNWGSVLSDFVSP